jgi:alkylation response protein AidB-like acyl-CoA dehydrogenase
VISFELTEEQELIRDTLKEFASEAMRPIGRDCDESSAIPQDFLDTVWELGLSNTQIPEEYGGGGEKRDPVTNAILLEELGYGDVALAIAATAPNAFVNAIVDYGTEDQKKALLPLFCGDRFHTAALAVLEHGPLADAAAPATKAEPKGEGYVLSGGKSWVVLGDRASHFLVVARNNGSLDAFIVPRDADGLAISQNEQNLGLRGLPTSTLELERVELPASARLGGEAGCDVRKLLDNSRTALAAAMVGVSRAVLEFAVPYAKERVAFDQAIAQKQGIAFKLADMHIETESTRWLVWKAATQLEQGLDATRSAHFARNYAAEQSMWIADQGVQVLGGHGFVRDHLIELWFRSARTISVLEGTLGI